MVDIYCRDVDRSGMLRFSLFYLLNMLILFLLFTYQKQIDLQMMYTDMINPVVTFFINIIGIEAMHSGINIILPTNVLKVIFGCNGLEAILIFVAGVLAFSAGLRYKLKYILQGIILISAINIFRLVILAYVLEVHGNYFNLMHDYVTQHMMIFLAILLFLIFTSNVKSMKEVV